MAKTRLGIEHEIYIALEGFFADRLRGNFYLSDTRPLDAMTEDAVLLVGATTATQVQAGRARVNIYIPDINAGGKRKVPDKARAMEVAAWDNEIVTALNEAQDDYIFWLAEATGATQDYDTGQTYVSIGMRFRFTDY